MEFENGINQIVRSRMTEFRKKYLQISVEEFSKQTGIDIGRIRKIEAGQGKVRLSEMVTVMDVYSLSSEYLLGRVDRPKPIITDPQTAKAWAAIERLSMEDLHKLYDMIKKKQGVTTICYGEEKVWDSREEAEAFFLQAMADFEGSEQNRYATIYTKLQMGLEVCSDDE